MSSGVEVNFWDCFIYDAWIMLDGYMDECHRDKVMHCDLVINNNSCGPKISSSCSVGHTLGILHVF